MPFDLLGLPQDVRNLILGYAAQLAAADLARAPDTQLKAQENEGEGKLGAGGMADTRDPEPFVNESDKRQSISQAPSFEEYLKSRQ